MTSFEPTTDGGSPAWTEKEPLRERIQSNPEPFLRWGLVAAVLFVVEFGTYAEIAVILVDSFQVAITAFFELLLGRISPEWGTAVLDIQTAISGSLQQVQTAAADIPTLFGRETIPNQGYKVGPNGPWKGTFLGLEPALAWALRFTLIVIYSIFTAYWSFRGWLVFREQYRHEDWTPTDDMVRRLRGHRWGQFGIAILVMFLMMAMFAPALGPTTVTQNIKNPYSHDVQYFNEDTGSVETVAVGTANFESKSKGSVGQNVGIMAYDDYGRFHPFGTLPNGRDLFTFMMGGARISLVVAGLSIVLASFIAATLSLVSAYYTGWIDLTILTTAEGVMSIPQLLLLIMVSMVFANHWLGTVLDGGFILALVFAFTTWPFLWRAVRGPALQVAEEGWIQAAKSYGQRPRTTMRKHMLPYILGYLLVYASMSTGGIIIGLAALSFLGNGLGINPPTPAWGRAVSLGQPYVAGPSWHISLLPGLMIVFLVTGLNAFGDGIRDAIDPESMADEGEEVTVGGGG